MTVDDQDMNVPLRDILTAAEALAMPEHEQRIRELVAIAFLNGRAIGATEGENTDTYHGVRLEQEDLDDIDIAEETVGQFWRHHGPAG